MDEIIQAERCLMTHPRKIGYICDDLEDVLKTVYGLPASVTVITQHFGWKYGKTDFSLFLAEMLWDLDLIDLVASNTETYGEYKIEFINDFANYDEWSRRNNKRKMYIFDEVIEASMKRRAMSNANIGWVKRIPQLSKGRSHLVVVTQSQRLTESAFFNWTFLRGIWTKLSKSIVKFVSPQLFDEVDQFVFEDIPKTRIGFNQYEFATFHEKGIVKTQGQLELTRDDKIVLYAKQGMHMNEIAKKLSTEEEPLGHETVWQTLAKRAS